MPALGFLAGVDDPQRPETRHDAYRLLMSYVLDPRDEDFDSSFAPKPAMQKIEQRAETAQVLQVRPPCALSVERPSILGQVDRALVTFTEPWSS